MKNISNETLVFLLIVTIVVSVGSTLVSIQRINKLQLSPLTGMASTATGYVNISIGSVASVSVVEGQIDFGSCTPNATIGSNLSSNVSDFAANSWGSPGVCTGAAVSAPDNITIKNDGNMNINVTVRTDTLASTLLEGSEPWPPEFSFMARNASSGSYGGVSYGPGCLNRTTNANCIGPSGGVGGLQWNWVNFSSASIDFCACDNLTSASAIFLFAKLNVPANAKSKGSQRATLTITATEI